MRIFSLKLLETGYILTIISLFLYSFTQVDLGLTLTRWPVWQENIQKTFQHIGYFDRPLSTALYFLILLFLYLFYFLFINRARTNKITKKKIWTLIFLTSIILAFSYNAFSYDLFNYVFDAKIVTHYHQNPYEHKALDYAGEPMLGFMHWTHRTYPYGPSWLAITVPLSFLGMQFFLGTLILFKFLMVGSFVGTTFYIGKILKKISPQHELLGVVFFAFNPLIIIESLVSSHNDIVMMFFAVFALYLFIEKKYAGSFFSVIFSIGLKFATVFMLPAILWNLYKKDSKRVWENTCIILIIGMIIPIIIASFRTNFQPWYLLYVFPFAALLPNKYYVLIPSIIISLFALFQYVPFLYLGNWNPPVPFILNWLMIISCAFSLFGVSMYFFRFKKYE